MKANRRIRKGNKASHLILAPMIDVIFQLVLFLLVSSTFSVKPSINMKLPSSSISTGSDEYELVVSLLSNGDILMNNEKIESNHISSALKLFDPKYPVMVEAEEDVTNKSIMSVFSELGKRGYSDINLRTSEKVNSSVK